MLLNFPDSNRINEIIKLVPSKTCGSASACIVFEKLGIKYSPKYIVTKGRDGDATLDYPESGSSILGTALSIASSSNFETVAEYLQ